jgi:hypothetical protein
LTSTSGGVIAIGMAALQIGTILISARIWSLVYSNGTRNGMRSSLQGP